MEKIKTSQLIGGVLFLQCGLLARVFPNILINLFY